MPTFRPDIEKINPYVPGRPIEDVAREIGMEPSEIIKLASNESPDGPFPGVLDAAVDALAESNRYPDNDFYDVGKALSSVTGISSDHFWFGSGSTGLIMSIGAAVGGPGTSVVYAWPSFVMYRIGSRIAISEAVEVPLTPDMTHDLDAMRTSVRDDTTLVYLCNPNNPTGTIVGTDELEVFIDTLPQSVLIVVDEAYHHYVTDPRYRTLISLATERPNVVVLRTFSKIYGLASHRIGVAVGLPETLRELRKTQAPFSVSQFAQRAAEASLDNDSELARRAEANAQGRESLAKAFADVGVRAIPSQTNFVFAQLGNDSSWAADGLTKQGVIIRPMSAGWIRVTVGTPEENQRFIAALAKLIG